MNNLTKSSARRPEIPEEIQARWQRIVDLMAQVVGVPAGLIMRIDPPQIEVLRASATEGNPYYKGEHADLNTGLYCETVMKKRASLLVPDALKDPEWDHNPDIKLGMTFYLGYPLIWPDGEIFGTICVLDGKENLQASQFRGLISEFQQVVERDLRLLVEAREREELLAELHHHRDHLREMVAEQTAALLKTERELGEAQRIAHLGSWDWDIRSGTHHWSDEFYRILGLLPQEIDATYERFLASVHPDDRQAVDQANQEAISDPDKTYYIEFRVVRPEGTERVVYAHAEIVFDQNQRPLRMIGTIQDITARKQMEKEAGANQIGLAMALEAGDMVTWEWDIPTRSIRYSDNIRTIVRGSAVEPYCSLDALIPKLHPEDREGLAQALDQTCKQGTPFECEYRVHMLNGTYRWILGKGKRVVMEGDKPVRVLGLSMDITERKQREEALRESERRERERAEELATLLEVAPTPVIIVHDPNGVHMTGNRAADELLRHPRGAEISLSAPPENKPRHFKAVKDGRDLRDDELPAQRAASGIQVQDFEFSLVFNDGTTRHVVGYGTPLLTEDGHPRGAVHILVDITERKRAEQALRASETRFKLLSETAGRLLVTDNPQGIVNELCRDVMAHLDCQAFFNFLVNEQIGRLHLNAWAGIPPEEARKIEWLDFGVAVCGCAARDGCRIVAEHIPITPDVRTELVKSYGIKAYACHPLLGAGGRVIGTLSFGTRSRETFSEEDLSLMKAVADQVATAMERMKLIEDLQQFTKTLEQMVKDRTAELAKLSSQLIDAQENERRRVSYDLHDNVWQALGIIKSQIEHLFTRQDNTDLKLFHQRSKELITLIQNTVLRIRSMQGDLWPYVLDDIGILATIEWYCREFNFSHPALSIEKHIDLAEEEIPAPIKIVIYREMQEALSNVAKHSNATHVTLSLLKKNDRIEFTVEDNGIGFDPEETVVKTSPWGGLGLLCLKARAALSGGIFGVESAKGKGTTLRASWPLSGNN
jgi:PAS domain S-box-containing protein